MKFRCATSRSTNVTVKTYILLFSSNKGYYNYQYFTVEQIKKKNNSPKNPIGCPVSQISFHSLNKDLKILNFQICDVILRKALLGERASIKHFVINPSRIIICFNDKHDNYE